MALKTSDYLTYLNNIVVAPEPKPVVVIPEDQVTFFTPGAGYAPMPTPPMRKISVPERKDEPFPQTPRKSHIEPEEPEVVLAPPEEELVSLERNPLLWAKQQAVALNTWQIADEWFKSLTHTSGGDLAMEFLLEQAAKVPQAKRELDRLADKLYFATQVEIEAYDHASDRQEDARQHRQKFIWPEDVRRPAELYRSFVRPLRKAKELGYHVQGAINALVLMQNRPIDELETPGWIDGYTGEVDAESDIITIRPLSDVENSVEMIGDPDEIVGYVDMVEVTDTGTKKMRQSITRAEHYAMLQAERASSIGAEGFNSEDELDEVVFDDRDPRTPTWEEIATELNPQNLGELSHEFKPYRDEFRWRIGHSLEEARDAAAEILAMDVAADPVFSALEKDRLLMACWDAVNFPEKRHPELQSLSYGIYKRHDTLVSTIRAGIFERARKLVRESNEARNILHWLQRKADAQEFPVDLIRLFLGLQHGLGFTEEDCAEVKLSGPYQNLYDFLEANWEEISEQIISGSLGRPQEVSQAEINELVERTLTEISVLEGDPNAKEVTHHPAYIKGYLTAMANAKNITTQDDSGYHNAAVEAGWDSWREAISPEGNLAYHAARKAKKDAKEAMKAFWQVVNRPKIVAVRKDGLTIQSGDKQRQIDWHIARLKVQNKELVLSEEDKNRLVSILVSQHWGNELCRCL